METKQSVITKSGNKKRAAPMHPLRHECACEFQRIANISTVIHQPRQLARRTRIQRVHGTELEDKIWKLSLKGLKQIEIANQLGISPTRVSRYISRRMSRIEESAPQTPEQFAELRGIMHAHLEAIYAGAAQQPVTPQSLGTQLKCLAQIAKLFGLNLECNKRSATPTPQT